MRVSYVIAGLLGLAGFAVAVPTPESVAVQIAAKTTQQLVDTLRLVSPNSVCITPDRNKSFLTVCSGGVSSNVIPNEWLGTCMELSDHVAYQVTILVQDAGLICKFHDDSNECNGDSNTVYISKTLDIAHQFEPPSEFGSRVKYLLCKKGDWRMDAGELEARDVDMSLDATPNDLSQTDTN